MAKRPRSPAQRAASRANGRRSSGPKSEAGKARSRRNALRHGLRATALEVLPQAAAQPAQRLVETVRERLAPRDVIEAEFADGIAMALWRLRRAQQLEEAVIGGGQPAGSGGPAADKDAALGRVLGGRTSGANALALLLRYRSQAVNELGRLFRLLEAHRRAAAEVMAVAEAGNARPANDNQFD